MSEKSYIDFNTLINKQVIKELLWFYYMNTTDEIDFNKEEEIFKYFNIIKYRLHIEL